MTGDLVNAIFEFTGVIFVSGSIIQVQKDKRVAGIWWPQVLFFTLWGFWNLWYYPSLGQSLSFAAGASLALANSVYVALLLYYRRRK